LPRTSKKAARALKAVKSVKKAAPVKKTAAAVSPVKKSAPAPRVGQLAKKAGGQNLDKWYDPLGVLSETQVLLTSYRSSACR
jgi:hypothetical protein